jgi:hypothetical protein
MAGRSRAESRGGSRRRAETAAGVAVRSVTGGNGDHQADDVKRAEHTDLGRAPKRGIDGDKGDVSRSR